VSPSGRDWGKVEGLETEVSQRDPASRGRAWWDLETEAEKHGINFAHRITLMNAYLPLYSSYSIT